MRSLFLLLAIIAVGYLAICILLYFQQDRLVYFPSRASLPELEAQAKREGFLPWLDLKGEQIGWKSAQGDPNHALLLYHGNAGQALDRTFYLPLCRQPGVDRKLYLLEYPGYGAREGVLSEKTFTEAAVTAIDTLAARSETRIWLMGESLGSGVACAALAMRPAKIAGLVLITPFDSFGGAAKSHYPWVPTGLLLKTRFNSVKNLAAYHGPVAFLVAERDQVVPMPLGIKLYDSYAGPKRLWKAIGAGHNNTDLLLADWQEVANWLKTTAH